MKRKEHFIGTIAAFVLMVLFSLTQWFHAGHTLANDGRLIVWFFDVGQGDAIFIESPTGKQMLIDGGPGNTVLEKLGRVMPFYDRSIDYVIATHPHADHIGGLTEVLTHYQVDNVYTTGVEYNTPISAEFNRRLKNRTVHYVTAPKVIDLGAGVLLQIIYPTESLVNQKVDDVNTTSITAILTYGDSSVLLPGDISTEEEIRLLPSVFDIDVLKVAHHGSQYSTSVQFLQKIKPEVAVIEVGENNRYGHPKAQTLQKLIDVGATIFRTDLDGDVRLISDGGQPTVEAESL